MLEVLEDSRSVGNRQKAVGKKIRKLPIADFKNGIGKKLQQESNKNVSQILIPDVPVNIEIRVNACYL